MLLRRLTEERWAQLDTSTVLGTDGAGPRDEFEALARQTPGIHAGYTSLSFAPSSAPRHAILRQSEDGFVSMSSDSTHQRRDFESMGGYLVGSPIVGPNPAKLCQSLAALLAGYRVTIGELIVPGVIPQGPMHEAVDASFRRQGFRVWASEPVDIAYVHLDTERGISPSEAFLAGKSRTFRRAIERARRACEDVGIRFEHVPVNAGFDQLLARILEVESRSWKADAAAGLYDPDLYASTIDACRSLHRDEKLRVSFARHGERDVSYVLGAVVNGVYVGMQFSFDRDYAAYRLGDHGQLATMDRVANEGVREYSLGSITEATQYKLRWADELRPALTLFIR
ncbi:MAG: GNAT family N-acetyltransferase [Myxococcota bacterium]